MKKFLLFFTFSLLFLNENCSSTTVRLQVKKEGGELKIINRRTQAGIIERGGKNYWEVTYATDPGEHILSGKNPNCPVVVQSALFENEKAYKVVLTEDCRIESSLF